MGANNSFSPKRKARRFLWYLVERPFNDSKSAFFFDHDHWWKNAPECICHDAALYELLRRHPNLGELQRWIVNFRAGAPNNHSSSPPSFEESIKLTGPVPITVRIENEALEQIAWKLQFFSLKPWTKLTLEEQMQFQQALKSGYPGKGRDLTKGVFDITGMAQAAEHAERDVGGPSFEHFISEIAAAYAKSGRVILAFDTDFDSVKSAKIALKQMEDIFWKNWKMPRQRGRAHESDWLTAIEDFEVEFAKKGYEQFKLGYTRKFKKFIAHFENGEARGLRSWWRRMGRTEWAAQGSAYPVG